MLDRERYRLILKGLGRIFRHQGSATTPSIVCEECHHQQSPRTTNNAVLASILTLNAHLLAIFNDLENQYWTIRTGGVNVVVTLLIVGTLLGFVGAAFWTIFLLLPYLLGLWDLWWCIWGTLERIVDSFDENEGFVHVQADSEAETNEHLVERKDNVD